MLTTITATPRDTVQPGARSASKAVMSHAHANANVAIIGRASDDTLGLETAAASTSKITTSANTLNSPIEEVMAAAPPPAPHANRRSQRRESPLRTAPTTRGAGPLRRRQAPIADLRFGDKSPDGTWRSCIFPSCLQASVEPSLSPGPGLDQRLATVWSLTMPPVPKPSRDAAHRSPTSLRLARPRTQRDSRRGPIDAGARDNRPAHQVPGVSMPTEPTRVARPLRSWSLPLQTDRDAPSFRTSPHNSDSSTVLASSDQLRPDVCNVYAGQARRSVFSATKANLRTRPTRNQSLQSRWAASSSSSALGPICPAISTASAANSLVSDSAMARWV